MAAALVTAVAATCRRRRQCLSRAWQRANVSLLLGPLTKPRNAIPANQQASDDQECLMNVVALLIAHAKSAGYEQLGPGSFDHPSDCAQAAAMLGVPFGDHG